MKTAHQVREYVRRRCLHEGDKAHHNRKEGLPWVLHRCRELAFIEVLNAFDTLHKTKLKMPRLP